MGRRKRGSVSGYFRQLFDQHPEWLEGRSNDAILEQYRNDHGIAKDGAVPQSIKNNLANLKSALRKKSKIRGGKKMVKVSQVSGSKLEALEELIDECLTLAKTLDREGLDQVIRKLRSARNDVVWKLGQ